MAIHAPAPNETGQASIQELKRRFHDLDQAIADILVKGDPQNRGSREVALARTNLEQASMWATKALCHAFPKA